MNEKLENFLKLFLQTKCENCGKFCKKYGFCFEHIDLKKIKNDFREILVAVKRESIDEKYFLSKLSSTINEIKFKIYKIKKDLYDATNKYIFYCEKLIGKKFKENFKMTPNNLKYKIAIEYYKTLENEMQSYFGETVHINDILQCKMHGLSATMYTKNLYFLKNMLNMNTTDIKNTNNIFLRSFVEDIYEWDNILYIKEEYNVNINNTNFRFDFYILIRTAKNTILRVFLEIDEMHHFYNKSCIEHDRIKDLYCFENGISLCRYHCKTNHISTNDINNIKKFITDIININFPQYFFSQKYLNHKKSKIHISLQDFQNNTTTSNNEM